MLGSPDRGRGRPTAFIVLEGTDGSGKTTIRRHLFTHLRNTGHDVLSIQGYYWLNPAHTQTIVEARFLGVRHEPESILDAYAGDKEELTKNIIAPHLRSRHILCDRYVISDAVFQHTTWGTPMLTTLQRYAHRYIAQPDAILFIDSAPEVSIQRLSSRPESRRHPWEKLERIQRNYSAFQSLLATQAAQDIAPIYRIQNSGTLDEVKAEALRLTQAIIADRSP